MSSSRWRESVAQLFPGLLGLWLALAPVKFGTPVILDSQIARPTSWLEATFQSWPVAWGYGLCGAVLLCGLVVWSRRTSAPLLVVALPALWLAWQCLSAAVTVQPDLTRATLPHFFVCAAAFYLGLFPVTATRHPRTLWLGIAGGWLVVVLIGWRQHFGGLAEMREFFYAQTNWREQPPELIAKIASPRIFSTLFYPNALAGVLLLFTPLVAAGAWCATQGRPRVVRQLAVAVPLLAAAACLVWSGSKAGWLIAVAQAAIALVIPALALARAGGPAGGGDGAGRLAATPASPPPSPGPRMSRERRRGRSAGDPRAQRSGPAPSDRTVEVRPWLRSVPLLVALGVVVAGLGGFAWRYQDYFARGATSVSARLDYWSVAASNAMARPLLGSGPGTFMEVYRHAKPPEAEMTRLTHNDYLQQAADSGLPGALLFLAVVGGALGRGIRGWRHPLAMGVWLGVAGIAMQSVVEFGLYIPAIAWPWFVAMGWLVGRPGQPDRS